MAVQALEKRSSCFAANNFCTGLNVGVKSPG